MISQAASINLPLVEMSDIMTALGAGIRCSCLNKVRNPSDAHLVPARNRGEYECISKKITIVSNPLRLLTILAEGKRFELL